jgi:hypothetical protein
MTHRRTWQKMESAVAAILGGRRRGGITRTDAGELEFTRGEDVVHPRFAIECKLRAKLAFIPWFRQAEGYAWSSGKTPLLVCREKGTGEMFAVMRLADLAQLLQADESPASELPLFAKANQQQ